jgi:recombination protein RecT
MAETTQVANQEPQTFSVALTEKLNSVAEALPKDFNKARFVQNALALVNDNPQLQKYSKAQLMSGLMKGAYLGLDFYSKECYLVPYGNQLNYQTDYRGAKKLAKKYSIRPIKDIYAKLVREGDDFEESIENGEQTFSFKPKAFNDGKIIGAFAVVLYKDGGMAYDTMTLADLENTRKSSKASNSPAWKNFTGEMYKKTVLHRLCKHIELDFENPTQQNAFYAGVEIETDPEKAVQNEIDECANSEEFVVESDGYSEEPVPAAEPVETEIPSFMSQEEM